MKRPDVFTELEAAAVGCIALEGTASEVHTFMTSMCLSATTKA